MLRQTTAFINLKSIENNISVIRSKLKKETRIMAAVKADAYGHGVKEVSLVLYNIGVTDFAVATLDEAIELREILPKSNILILGFTHPELAHLLADNNITQTVYSLDFAAALSQNLKKCGKKIKVHLAIETGMGRIGFENVNDAVKACGFTELVIEGAFTHFSCADFADEQGKDFTKKQFEKYIEITSQIEKAGIELKLKHCANSAAIFKYPEYQLDMVRAGIVLYGLYPNPDDADTYKGILPAMQLKSVISHIKEIDKGATIGYGADFIAQKPMRVATVACGYADGMARVLCKGFALVSGKRAKILGRICMDQLMIDVTDIKDAEILSEVTLFGESEGERLSADELAKISGTINYQIVCDVSKRVIREYK